MPRLRPKEALPVPPMREGPGVVYAQEHGELWQGDATAWLAGLPTASVDLVFADPPYNLARAEWDSFANLDTYLDWCVGWLGECQRVLRPTGSLYVCGFSEVLAELVPRTRGFSGRRWLVWHYRNKANLGRDWGRSHESILHLRMPAFELRVDAVRVPYGAHTQRYPAHPQALTSQYGGGKPREGAWTPDPRGAKPRDVLELPTTCNGMGEKTPHPTQKPEALVRRLVLAASDPGQLVIDPFSGSGTTCVVAEQLGRRWAGCDADAEYHRWAAARIAAVVPRPDAEWLAEDHAAAARRTSIR